MQENTFDTEQINLLIKSRRSTYPKQYVPGKVIPDEIINQLLENANWAPTHKKTQPWTFTVFTGEGLKKFSEFQSELYKTKSGENFKQESYDKLKNNPLLCSHIIAIGMRRTTDKPIPEMEEIEAVACAVQNIYLTATAYGIGGYWGSGGVTYYEEAKSFFGLEEKDKLLGFFHLGYIESPSNPAPRKPITEKVTWVRD